MNKKIKMIDLFSGAGGLTLGFFQNDFEIVESVESDICAVKTFNYNFKRSDIPKDITDETIRQNIEDKHKNKIDAVIGGFPCQGFSIAGKRDPSDPRNQLYKYTIDIIKRTNPKYFVLENVKGILSMEKGEVIKRIQSSLSEIGYYTSYTLATSSKFGVPQKRQRVFFIGSSFQNKNKVDLCINLINSHTEQTITVREAISDLQNVQENYLPNHIFTKNSPQYLERIKKLKVGETLSKSYADAYKRIDYDAPSPTVKENHGGVFIHPIENRFFTPRELAGLQTFPDDFIFCANKSQTLKQIGNAVPVKMAYEIASIVKKVFES
ncbi:MAG: DNA cytosine methyltransferase [Acholeplasmatales bacterium]|jgi:DNA (cytosine-5)-methyltransferase 1|nr:DNA cytosine methyltransferase [Acholeplasmatales bacterium]